MSEDAYVRAYIPTCETYGWTGGPVFSTRIVTRQNGRENRNADWAQPQHEFALPFQGLTQDQYVPIKRMHLNRRGAWGVFLYRDRLDSEADQEVFAIAEAGQDTFQLLKNSTINGVGYQRLVRALYRPDPADPGQALDSDIVIRVDGAPTTAFTLNRDTGEVVFDAPMTGGELLDWSGVFSIWVRFVSDKLPFTIVNRGSATFYVEGSIDLLEMAPPVQIESSSS